MREPTRPGITYQGLKELRIHIWVFVHSLDRCASAALALHLQPTLRVHRRDAGATLRIDLIFCLVPLPARKGGPDIQILVAKLSTFAHRSGVKRRPSQLAGGHAAGLQFLLPFRCLPSARLLEAGGKGPGVRSIFSPFQDHTSGCAADPMLMDGNRGSTWHRAIARWHLTQRLGRAPAATRKEIFLE